MLAVYQDCAETQAAMPVIAGKKSEAEKFAGAHITYTLEAMMGDRRALQSCTSHNLGDNFARGFGIQYLDKNNELQYVWQTSWGFSTRFVGGIVMVHGDDKGLVLPPRVAPTQVVIIPIAKTDDERMRVSAAVAEIRAALADQVRVEVDDREGYTPGFKFNEWEMRGVPLRIEIGPKDLDKQQVVFARRDTGAKSFVPRAGLVTNVQSALEAIQTNMFARAKKFMDDNTFVVDAWGEFKERMASEGGAGFMLSHWCGKTECEKEIQEETRATIRVIPFDQVKEKGACVKCGEASEGRVVFAKAY
jgi:prolyl-tRNA synthetase